MKGGRALVESLRAQGVDTVFGLISIHMMEVYDALYDLQDSIRFIGGRHEQAVAYMADGYARASGKPGVFLTSTGPGAANAVGAMGEAWAGHSRVLHVTSNVELALVDQRRGAIHEPYRQAEMFRHVADWSALIRSVEEIPDRVYEAFQRFQTRPPRPIELELPVDLQGQEADVEVLSFRESPPRQGDAARIEEAVRLMETARRPAIIAGGGVLTAAATPELVQLAERLDAPVLTSDAGKGAFPADHPLYVGSIVGGRVYGHNPVHQELAACDLVLAVGTRLPYRFTAGVGLKLPANLVHINLDSEVFHKNYPARVAIEGDAKAVLRQLLTATDGKDLSRGPKARQQIRKLRQQLYQGLVEEGPNQQRTMDALRQVIPREAVVVFDSTVPYYWAMRGFDFYEPRTFLSPHGWGGIGFGFPAALGAKAARPDVPVVVITGDGGFQYNMQELGTALQEGLDVIVLLFNDNAWGILKGIQRRSYQGHMIGTDLKNPDFLKWAEAYGAPATRAYSLDELTQTLERALASNHLHIIEVPLPDGFEGFR